MTSLTRVHIAPVWLMLAAVLFLGLKLDLPCAGDIPARFNDPVTYRIALQGYSGQYVAVENAGDINVNRTTASRNETFDMTDVNGGVIWSGDYITLRSWQGWYVSARYDIGNLVFAAPQWGPGAWEHFQIFKIVGNYWILTGVPILPGDRIGIRSYTGQWLSARYDRSNNCLSCDQSNCWGWETFTLVSKGYSPEGAANYALNFALYYNSQFTYFEQDCTNAASQALFAGGWVQDRPAGWFYDGPNQNQQGLSWIQANSFYKFMANSGRAQPANSQYDLQVGDIIAADWRKGFQNNTKGHDGIIDHIMVVTEKLADGRVRVSYHSNDRQNKLFDEVVQAEPTSYTNYFFWHLRR